MSADPPLARWYQLCLDAQDVDALGTWWADVLGLSWQRDADYPGGDVTGGAGAGLRIEAVPEPGSGKNRVHPDIYAASVAGLVDLGATVLLPEADDRRWTVMSDPEGNEFCAFVRDDVPDARLHGVGIDCADHRALTTWWADVLGADVTHSPRGFSTVEPAEGRPFTLDFATVPEARTVKNRMHWDVRCDDVGALLGRGASLLARPHGRSYWHVLRDPEGNEFCVFPDRV